MTDRWSDRRVLVTGATGIIGSALTIELVRRGARVAALVPDHDPRSRLLASDEWHDVAVVDGRLESWDDVERAVVNSECDTVFHLGAQAIVGVAARAPRQTFEANIRGSWHVLDAARLHADRVERVVVASSDKAYGASDVLPYTEAQAPRGTHPYDVSKSCTDLLSTTYAVTYGLPVAVARCGNVYGPGDLHWNRVVPGTIRSLLEGRRPEVRSDGTLTRDYVHVDDVVGAYLALADGLDDPAVHGEAFNFGPGEPMTVLEIVAAVTRAVGSDLEPVVLDEAVGEIPHQYLDATKARDVLGWTSSVPLDEGLARTVAWYREHLAT